MLPGLIGYASAVPRKWTTSKILRRGVFLTVQQRKSSSSSSSSSSSNSSSASNPRTCPDLKILFCGSDAFSATSLEALDTARRFGIVPISSIDVVCRPPKRVGRGMKEVREVPIVETASRLGLPVHKIDTFRGWDVPQTTSKLGRPAGPVNLIVAVSFGLLVPPRIINSVRYGGLNVHPSMLPDFRGAAPVEHSLLAGCTETGVSLQTLHPSKFDHGKVLLQEPVSYGSAATSVDRCKSQLADVGARLLIRGLRNAAFLDPMETVDPPRTYQDGSPVLERRAPKITPEHHHIQWQSWTAADIIRRQRVLGDLWSYYPAEGQTDANSRIKWTQPFWEYQGKKSSIEAEVGDMFYEKRSLRVTTCDGKILETQGCTVAGKPPRQAHEAAQLLFNREPKIRLT